jgi:hypothetical protein
MCVRMTCETKRQFAARLRRAGYAGLRNPLRWTIGLSATVLAFTVASKAPFLGKPDSDSFAYLTYASGLATALLAFLSDTFTLADATHLSSSTNRNGLGTPANLSSGCRKIPLSYFVQFSTCRPFTRPKSLVLLVTTVAPIARA